MTITAEHAEAMRAGRERQLAAEEAARAERKAAFTHWIRTDARLWRVLAAADEGDARKAAYAEWKANLDAIPVPS